MDLDKLQEKANLLRKWSLVSTSQAQSGHPTSCLSSADLMAVLVDNHFSYDLADPNNPANDRLIFSKGHAAPLLYALFALSGAFDTQELLTLRKFGSRLEGHPTPRFPYAEVATGSLGQGLSIGAGMAFALRAQVENSEFPAKGWSASGGKVQSLPKVYVLLGDGELAEGSVWEAANFSSYYKLANLIAIADINGLGQSQETMFGHEVQEYVKRFSAFGWETLAIDGHNFLEIDKAFQQALNRESDNPFVIIANTQKGKGVSLFQEKGGWHGKALKKEELEQALKELGEIDENLRFNLNRSGRLSHVANDAQQAQFKSSTQTPSLSERRHRNLEDKSSESESAFSSFASGQSSTPIFYKIGDQIATREVYGQVLAQLGDENPLIYALDGDVKNSTFSEVFKKAHPDRFIECFIAEQNMAGVALGLSKRGKIPFVSTFAAFLTRAFDQIRMAAISEANIKFVGSHAGVSIGEDGSSQMGLEDITMFASIPHSVILHPCDAPSTAKLVPYILSYQGISYLRTLRPKTPVIYNSDEDFPIGGSKILKSSKSDLLTVVSAGITVYEALKAYELLKKEGILVRVLDCYSLKPIDRETLVNCLNETEKNIIIAVEDHYEHGGLGDLVLAALEKPGSFAHIEKMAVSKIPVSGTKDELLDFAGISAKHIFKKVKEVI